MTDLSPGEQLDVGGLTFGVLGPLQVNGEAGPVRIPPGRQEIILSALLLEANRVVSTGPVELGTAELKKGSAKLRVEVVGTNAKSVGLRYMWGLDFVKLQSAQE